MLFGNTNSRLARRRPGWIGMERHRVEGRYTHTDLKLGRQATNSLHHFTEKTRAVLKTAAVITCACMGTQKLVSQIAVTMLYINEVKTEFPGAARGSMKLLNNSSDFAVREERIRVVDVHPAIEKGMMIKNARFGAQLLIRTTIAP